MVDMTVERRTLRALSLFPGDVIIVDGEAQEVLGADVRAGAEAPLMRLHLAGHTRFIECAGPPLMRLHLAGHTRFIECAGRLSFPIPNVDEGVKSCVGL